MWRRVRSYFVHYRRERKAAMAVASIALVVVAAVWAYPKYLAPQRPVPKVIVLLDSDKSNTPAASTSHIGDTLFSFDPNKLSDSGYTALGFSKKDLSTLRKYQAAGGHFRVKSDFSKLYFIDSVEYAALAPYIVLPERRNMAFSRGSESRSGYPKTQNELFSFDPNTLSDSGYRRLGFSPKEIIALRKYLLAIGRFDKPEDFAKLYSVDDEEYERLAPYIAIEPQKDGLENPDEENPSMKLRGATDINTADTVALKRVKGIGPYFAREIVSYRAQLGGYYALDQLMEIYGMDAERLEALKPSLSVGSGVANKIRFRTATAQELAEHPYIDLATANTLVVWREQTVDANAELLEESGLLDAKLYRKFAPYLDFR